MSKRRLSKQQQSRIAEKQQKQIADAGLTPESSQEKCNGRIVSHYGQQLDVESLETSEAGRIVRCHQRANLPPLVTGDLVVWEEDDADTGVILAAAERCNMFARPDAGGKLKPVASNIDIVLVVFAVLPQAFMNLIDRYLVAIAALHLEPLLVLNKIDLLEAGEKDELDNMLSVYEKLGYGVHRISALEGTGIAALETALDGKTTVLVGQSGVGKSSLVNRLGLAEIADVGDLSQGKYKGTHKTTTARLFHLQSCDVIDSPGIREFNMGHINQQQLLDGFVELRNLSGQCKFRDCSHKSEPGCAIQQAVTNGEINADRLDSYFRILQTLEST